ncbi:MAG: C4-dicarboxylate transporter DcuC [Bifidobacterium scardovii]|uniref:C4-dicarboxylate transporter DcuC n=1 Tax=Bifidobacterium scardovii TaxID=158787 RepID=UPI000666FE27|nr:C4-dicarboxylate transporter DcuC [Bifidobacterium scardovii]MBS6948454.1 C4-dicarboxylate transporter DcuC [Bifidobacterium scardovii]MDU3737721.1 C4-dicarboxylate transporter DcuC [Bifidobacterium scardovii]MDU5297497.1 C4-dicarboxylate transporter DcuC [Bifidobacterium scardovii]MDU5609802.1 C4-dicarboxylate transporter DcuC [Bifidobacterium scardovii]MDU5886601.1 C4-dicarboxylate transporter DcuC [Bifidobacterium scardovii]
MELVVMYLVAIAAVGIVGFMLIKKMDIKISLFLIGIILMYIALLMGKEISFTDFASSGITWLDPFKLVGDQFVSTLTSAGFIILILGGYTAYMSHIGANEVTVSVLAKPIAHIKSPYVLVPITFLLGNLLSLVIPSASNLAIILMATLFPVLRQAGMSLLSAAAVIATTATIMPTPLGSDNVAIAAELAKTDMFAGLTASEYVFKYHVLVSVPTLLVMAVAHYFWQKFMDKRTGADLADGDVKLADVNKVEGGALYRTVYAILPLLPIIMLLVVFAITSLTGLKIDLSVELASILSFVIAIVCELFRTRNGKETLDGTEAFFKGMGGAMPIVALLVAASVFVVGLKSIGLISELQNAMTGLQGSGMGFVLPLILVGLTALIVLLSGSGTALFFAMVPLMVPLAAAAGINVLAVSLPMGLAGNLLRAVSPVSAVVMIVAGSVKKSPIDIVRRTSVPMIVGVVVMFVLSMIVFLPMGA